jgi:hypothetical protein
MPQWPQPARTTTGIETCDSEPMMKKGVVVISGLASALPALLAATAARADIPAGYKGTPHGGSPKAIPGRVNLIDYDEGGPGVGFQVVHQGDVGCAGYDYRMDKPTATLCKTSAMEKDHWSAGPMMGMQYPSATTSDYYVGAVRPGDWLKVTVDVKTAGMYQLDTSWASAAGIDVKISFNGTLKTEYKQATTGDYHNWVPGPAFAMIQLDAGVQVMQFQSVNEHVNMDYVQFTLMGPGGTLDPSGAGGASGAGAAGTNGGGGAGGGAGGAAGGGDTSGAAGTTGSGGTTGSAGTTGAAGDSSAGGTTGAAGDSSGGTTGAAGTNSTGGGSTGNAGSTGTSTGSAGTGAHPAQRSSGGCALGADARGGGESWLVLAAAGAIVVGARRRRRR